VSAEKYRKMREDMDARRREGLMSTFIVDGAADETAPAGNATASPDANPVEEAKGASCRPCTLLALLLRRQPCRTVCVYVCVCVCVCVCVRCRGCLQRSPATL
jgi:hypothetical protein